MTPHELLCWPEDCGWRGRWWWGRWVRVWKEDDDVMMMNIDDESLLIIEQSELESFSCPGFDYVWNCFLTGFAVDWILTLYSWLFSFPGDHQMIHQVSSFFCSFPCQFAWFACSFHVWQHWFCTGSAYWLLPVPFWAASASAGVFRRRDSSLWWRQQWDRRKVIHRCRDDWAASLSVCVCFQGRAQMLSNVDVVNKKKMKKQSQHLRTARKQQQHQCSCPLAGEICWGREKKERKTKVVKHH